jgi:membrane-associated phospholipid phosphatase
VTIDLDRRLLRWMRTRGHSPEAERAVKLLASAGEWGAVWTAAALTGAAADPAKRSRWLRAAAVPVTAVGLNYAVKLAVRRPRPQLRGLPPLAGAPSSLSCPSAHATSSFAAAVAIGRVAPPLRPALLAGATAMALTRPYLGMHYPSDVLAGAALGTAIGLAVPGLGGAAAASAEQRLGDLVARQAGNGSLAGVA